jgi:hypothetical protein
MIGKVIHPSVVKIKRLHQLKIYFCNSELVCTDRTCRSNIRQMEDQQFVQQLVKIPVVSSAWNQAYNLYQKTKESNELLKSSLNIAEAGVKTVVDTSVVFGKPLVDRYQPQSKLSTFNTI